MSNYQALPKEDFLRFDNYEGSRVAQNIDYDLSLVKAIINIIKNKEVLYQIVNLVIEDKMSQLLYWQQEQIFESVMKVNTRFTIGVIIALRFRLETERF